jgi:hypothetical protein
LSGEPEAGKTIGSSGLNVAGAAAGLVSVDPSVLKPEVLVIWFQDAVLIGVPIGLPSKLIG